MSEYLIAQDVDECLFNSVKKHHQVLTKMGEELGWENLPSYQKLCESGGTHGAYGKYPGYEEINEDMRNDAEFNKNQDLIPGAKDALIFLQSILGIYLTTRPEHLSRVTYEEILRCGFPDREVVCRPRAIPLERTTPWKLDVLKQMSSQSDKSSLMIDDSISLHKAIKEKRDSAIRTILFAGPITPKGNGEKNWEEIKNMLEENA